MLTDTRIRNAKPSAQPIKLTDAFGLHLLIQPHGSKLWRLAYRFDGKQKTLALGVYPVIGLAQARDGRDEARKLLAQGVDPSALRKTEKHIGKAAAASTFRAVAGEMMTKSEREQCASETMRRNQWLLDQVYPAFGDRPVSEITARELLAVLRKIEERGRYETAHRVRSICGMVFRFAIATGRADRDPSADLRGALTSHQVRHHAAVIDPAGIGTLLRAIDDYEGHSTIRAALRLAPLVFVRPGELRHAEWQEVDLNTAIWSIPAEKMKMRRPHRVPLAKQSTIILRELQNLTGTGRLLFPSPHSDQQPISRGVLNITLRRLGYGSDEMTTHGFRSIAATRLNEMGWNPDAIERQLAHQESNAVRRAYTSGTQYWSERVEMMQAWADYLDGLRAERFC